MPQNVLFRELSGPARDTWCGWRSMTQRPTIHTSGGSPAGPTLRTSLGRWHLGIWSTICRDIGTPRRGKACRQTLHPRSLQCPFAVHYTRPLGSSAPDSSPWPCACPLSRLCMWYSQYRLYSIHRPHSRRHPRDEDQSHFLCSWPLHGRCMWHCGQDRVGRVWFQSQSGHWPC